MKASTSAVTNAQWPIRLRAMSFGITFAVVALEVAIVTIPIATVVWLAGFASPSRAGAAAILVALGYAAAIAIYTHLSPPGIRRRALDGDS